MNDILLATVTQWLRSSFEGLKLSNEYGNGDVETFMSLQFVKHHSQ